MSILTQPLNAYVSFDRKTDGVFPNNGPVVGMIPVTYTFGITPTAPYDVRVSTSTGSLNLMVCPTSTMLLDATLVNTTNWSGTSVSGGDISLGIGTGTRNLVFSANNLVTNNLIRAGTSSGVGVGYTFQTPTTLNYIVSVSGGGFPTAGATTIMITLGVPYDRSNP